MIPTNDTPTVQPTTPTNPPKHDKRILPKLNIQTRKVIPTTLSQPSNNFLKQPSSPIMISDSTTINQQKSINSQLKHPPTPITPTQQIYFESSDKFYEKYQLKQILGHGSSGMVNKCVKKDNSNIYVVKRTKCQPEQIQTMKLSYNLIKILSHPNIIKYKSLYISSSQHRSYLVMQNYQFPTLTQIYQQVKIFEEEDLQVIVYQLLDAIAYMHSVRLCHRDIKPDNILYDTKSKTIKIIDFGVSRVVEADKKMLTCTGTTQYKAPELFYSGYYDELIDQWAAGITIYQLITGKTPFSSSEYIKETIQNIENCNLTFEEEIWQNYSNFVKDLIKSLVCHRSERVTAEQAKNSLWFNSGHQQFSQSLKPRKYKKQHNFMNTVNLGHGKKTEQEGDDLRRSLPFLSGTINQQESDCDFSDDQIEVKVRGTSPQNYNPMEKSQNKNRFE